MRLVVNSHCSSRAPAIEAELDPRRHERGEQTRAQRHLHVHEDIEPASAHRPAQQLV
jgi:hypothetical protein